MRRQVMYNTMNWIDTHAHIYSKEFDADRDDMLKRSADSGVQRIFMPNIDHTSVDSMLEVEHRFPHCIPMMGLHPCSVKKDFERELYVVEEWLFKRKFAAVGEIGTDLYWDKTLWDYQREAFAIQIGWAKKLNLPIVIHCRESLPQTLEIVEALRDEDLRGVFHCFTGSVDDAKRIAALGFYIGIGGVATFKNGGLDKVLPDIPADRIVMETDSPYLAPVPHRGKRNEPAYIPLIAEKVADVMGVSPAALQEQTSRNAADLFDS